MPESMTNDGVWVLLRTNRLAMLKSWEPKAKTAAKQLKLELRKTKSILIWHSSVKICRTALNLGWNNLM